ncbi:exodeoxyribonuclease VII large subunit [Prochlorothrix hollandica]|uniref:exodeoxyribonuclease VII large subunit n=1 Tax=Prochlorothrix hollandica TaxID=1223 RepID=UPI00333E7730
MDSMDQPLPSTPQTALSVAGLTRYFQDLVEEDPQLRQVWVMGEVSSANPHPRGFFFTLQDPTEKVAINCVIWRGQQVKLAGVPAPTEQVIVLGSLRLFPGRSQYQLMVWQWIPAGEGLLALRQRQLQQRLEAEGLFEETRKRSIPVHPHTVAVITSPEAAAWGDIQRTVKHRYPGLRLLFAPAQVQGIHSPPSIVEALQRVQRDGRAAVIILSRGGGAKEDLACFNDERVVRAIAHCSIPIITGIGHQRDESLADLAADFCAHTPTAAAVVAVPQLTDLRGDHEARVQGLCHWMGGHLSQQAQRLETLQRRLQRLSPQGQLRRDRQHQASLRQHLLRAIAQRLRQEQIRSQALADRLVSLDPAAVIRRGYALVRQDQGEVLRDGTQVAVGDRLTITLAQGSVTARVESVESVEPG